MPRASVEKSGVVCVESDDDADVVAPTAVFEVISPSTALTDRRVKASEYASVAAIMVYVLLEQDRPEATIRRRSTAWDAETVIGQDASIDLPEIGISIPMATIYGPA